jgi:O-antigen/teichoic acid export membrane protein
MLHKAVAYTYTPRIVTAICTLISLPIVTSGLGASEYGLAAAVIALSSIVQVVADGGISAAVSRAIAEAAHSRAASEFTAEIRLWSKVQVGVAFVASLLVIAVGWSFGASLVPGMTHGMVIVVAASTTVGTLAGYIRSLLRTSFSFRRLSVMDVCESLGRSLAWTVVGLRFPHAVWLLVGEMLASSAALAVGTILCSEPLKRMARDLPSPGVALRTSSGPLANWREILHQGVVFLLARLATIGLTQVPILVAGRVGALGVAAVLAALLRLLDLVNGPIVVIGQIIGVRSVTAIRDPSGVARHRLWRQTWRICASWSGVVAGFVLVSGSLAHRMLPDVPDAPAAFGAFGIFLALHALAATFGLPIDYLGSAQQRVRLMIPIVVLQGTLLIIFGASFGAIGAVVVIDLCYLLLVVGYLRLAYRVMGGDTGLSMPLDAKVIFGLSSGWLATGLLAQLQLGHAAALVIVAISALAFASVVAFVPWLRSEYAPLKLLNLDAHP